MPGIPLVSREVNFSRDPDQMCRQEPRVPLSQEERTAAEESLAVYCKPVELYNILQRRALKNPLYLQRSLQYKLEEKHKKRVKLSISISGAIGNGRQTQSLFPLYIVLARQVSSTPSVETQRTSFYRFKQACKLTAFNGAENESSAQANFILPEINKLSAEINSGSVAMLLVSCADVTGPREIDLTKDHMFSPSSNIECYCLLGKIPVDFLHLSSPNLSLGKKVEMMPTVSMKSCFMKLSSSDEEKCLSFQFPHNSEAVSILQEVPIIVSAQELGAKYTSSNVNIHSNITPNSTPRVIRLRAGNVVFNYKYYNNLLHRTEVTEDYTCPFCLVKCASYKGLKLHLPTSHDLFSFQFWSNGDYQVVIVSVKPETSTSEICGDNLDPRVELVNFCRKPLRRMRQKLPTANATLAELRGDVNGVILTEQESAPGNTRKLSVEPRNRVLQKRNFFHSQRAQPMELEQVLGDEDSEDEADDNVLDLEDERMLDDFVDVTHVEKEMMHMWNIFVRKQRVLADAHIPWACEAFSHSNAKDLTASPQLLWCWRLFMVKLWNHGLVDSKTINKCNIMLDRYQNQNQNQNQQHIHYASTSNTQH